MVKDDAGAASARDAQSSLDAAQGAAGTSGTSSSSQAGSAPPDPATTDAGVAPPDPTATDAGSIAPGCSRQLLEMRAAAYLEAMSRGDPGSLTVHPSCYFTENGQTQTLGLGLWLSRPTPTFSRHALDETSCGTVTEAVLVDSLGSTIIFGVRLRYYTDQLIDVESHVVTRQRSQLFEPDAIAVTGADPWVAEIPVDKRMPADALKSVAQSFFDGIIVPSLNPPSAPTCDLKQNGVSVGDGRPSCRVGPTAERFDQVRLPVIDVTRGLVGAEGRGRGYIVQILFKIEEGTMIDIHAVGGSASDAAGW
jgi:hypothetical protein